MSDTFTKKLMEAFPLMYNDDTSIWIDHGWERIVFELSQSIQDHIDRTNSRQQWLVDNGHQLTAVVVEQVVVAQIKEKFGGLRFYYDGGDDYVSGLVDMAERWTEATCEVCGQPGRLRSGSWLKTLCDKHYDESKKSH